MRAVGTTLGLARRMMQKRSSMQSTRQFSSVYSWGTGDEGQLGHPSIDKSGLTQSYVELSPRLVEGLEGQDVKDIACGFSHSAAVTQDGRVLTWGKSKDAGLLGHSYQGTDGSHCLRPTQVSEGLEGIKIKSIACGETHTVAISETGDLFTWGCGDGMIKKGAPLGLGDTKSRERPTQILFGGTDEVKIKKVACGKTHTIALGEEGEVWTWGRGENGRLGNGGIQNQLEPFPVEFFLETNEECVDIAAGNSFCLALTKSGQIYGWGKNDQSQLGLGGGIAMDMYAMEDMPRLVENLENEKIVSICAGGSHALAINDKGEVFFWGMRLWMEPHRMSALGEHRIVQVDCGNGFSAALSDAGQLFTWGKGVMTRTAGVMGQGDRGRYAQPQLVKTLQHTPLQKVACGNKHAAAVTGFPKY